MVGRPAKVSRLMLLRYFRDLHWDASNFRLMIQDQPFAGMLERGEINKRNLSTALTRAVVTGHLERRGYRKGAVYRISPKGRQYLKDNS